MLDTQPHTQPLRNCDLEVPKSIKGHVWTRDCSLLATELKALLYPRRAERRLVSDQWQVGGLHEKYEGRRSLLRSHQDDRHRGNRGLKEH
jgi:hypothetical protein